MARTLLRPGLPAAGSAAPMVEVQPGCHYLAPSGQLCKVTKVFRPGKPGRREAQLEYVNAPLGPFRQRQQFDLAERNWWMLLPQQGAA